MNRDRAHSHPCQHCKTPVECVGSLERNHDGWPEVVCELYEFDHTDHLCESCYEIAEKELRAALAENV